MAKEFKLLLCIVWLIVAFSSASSVSADGEDPDPPNETTNATTTSEPTTTTLEPTTTTLKPTTTTLEPTTITLKPTTTTLEPTTITEATTSETTTTSEANTTTTNPGNTTAPPDPTGTTQTPSTTKPVPPTTERPDPCASNPCGRGSTCAPRADNAFVCLCLPGDVYSITSRGCDNAKVFPGDLNVPKIPYDPKMEDKRSQEFRKASVQIIDALSPFFKNNKNMDGYIEAIVVEIQQASTTTRVLREVGVKATVDIIFEASSEVSTEKVNSELEKAVGCTDCDLAGGSFTEKSLCDSNPCDSETTTCTSTDGIFTCECSEGYLKTDFSDRVCVACPSGEQAKKDSVTCEACPFGYSGFNCDESWQLVLVIVGSVLGGLLLISLILLPVVAVQCSEKRSKSNDYEDIGTSYASPTPAKLPLSNGTKPAQPVNGSSFADAGVPKIPRATTSNWDSRTNLEMTQSNSRQNLISADRNSRLYDDQDDLSPYAPSRPGSYAQARPQNNPYAQRPQVNPYAQSQGQSNPYYSGRH